MPTTPCPDYSRYATEVVAAGGTHFILMLDSSGTMSRQTPTTNWQDLTQEVQAFMRIQGSGAGCRSSRVSVITYDDISRVVIENEAPSVAFMSRIQYMGHGTNFEKPLGDAYRLAKRYEG